MTEQIFLYGIHNCDTVKKARKWLDVHNLDHHFVDLRKDGTDKLKIKRWIDAVGEETLLNKRGTTWRKLSPEQQHLDSEQALVSLLSEHPTLIKRPVLEVGRKVLVGYSEADYLGIK